MDCLAGLARWCFALIAFCMGASAWAVPCEDPTAAFSASLNTELGNLQGALKGRGFTEASVADVMTKQRKRLCEDLFSKTIDMKRAVEQTRLTWHRVFFCKNVGSSEPTALAREYASKFGQSSGRILLAIEKFCGKVSGELTFDEKYRSIHEMESEHFCITESMDVLPGIADSGFLQFPPVARMMSAGKALCERLKRGELSVRDARYELQAVRLKERERFGNSEFAFLAAGFVWSVGSGVSSDHPYYWGVMMIVGFVLFLIFFPLFLLGERFGWEWTETAAFAVFSTFGGIAMVSAIVQFKLGDYEKLLGMIATIVGIGGSIIAAALGLRKLLGKSDKD